MIYFYYHKLKSQIASFLYNFNVIYNFIKNLQEKIYKNLQSLVRVQRGNWIVNYNYSFKI